MFIYIVFIPHHITSYHVIPYHVLTQKVHLIWNQYLSHKPKPDPLRFVFVFHELNEYLSVCDNYEASQHKDPKQKWWNNQKASEMSNGFLPSALRATDQVCTSCNVHSIHSRIGLYLITMQMERSLGGHIAVDLQCEVTDYCMFEVLSIYMRMT